jgi:PAS domain S-box-containing protein
MQKTSKSSVERLRDPDVLLSILDNLPTSIFVKDKDLRFVYSNHIHCEMIGKSESDLLGKSDADFYSSDVAPGFLARDREVISNGLVNEAEERAAIKEGLSRTVLTRKARLTGPDGKTYLIGTNSDLTEIKKREDQLRALADAVPVGTIRIRENGTIPFTNALVQTYLGTTTPPQSLHELRLLFRHHDETFPGAAGRFEVNVAASDGESRSLLVISSGWMELKGSVQRSAMVSIIDVTETKQLRRMNEEISRLNQELAQNMQSLRQAQDELVKKGRMEQLGQLTATIAHELRNPLGAVSTSSYVLERKLQGKDLGVDQQVQRIATGIKRCDNIITQLLDFSRSKKLTCKLGDMDVWLAQLLKEDCAALPAMVKVEFRPGLAGKEVPFDPQRLRRAIINLVSNASEAMVGDGQDPSKFATQSPCIEITTGHLSGSVYIEVKDNGPGMDKDVLAKIREPLFTTKSFGTGLGVPAVEQIAAQHGGRLDIESQLGAGARFVVVIPATASSVAA